MLIISRHIFAHSKQASAHSWQWSMFLCCLHSSPQASHISAQIRHKRSENSDPLAINLAAMWHISAQSWSSWIHLVSILISSSCRQAVAQREQATAHLLHASMHSRYSSFDILFHLQFYAINLLLLRFHFIKISWVTIYMYLRNCYRFTGIKDLL